MILEHVQTGTAQAPARPVTHSHEMHWSEEHNEGKLSVDVSHNDTHLFVISTMAGAVLDKIAVFVHNDLLTIRGERHMPLENNEDLIYFYNECFWGTFSRTIVLPTHVKGESAHATYKNGILSVSIPKQNVDTKVPIEIIE